GWDAVLRVVTPLRLPPRKLQDLYEHVAIELIEMRELAAARSLVRQADPLLALRDRAPDRYTHLERLMTYSHFDERQVL
ncbi:hypothetical protein HK405_014326, partial [Cladochytrium tenue]